MANINILPPHVADMIAAGEVVERPASVIKELMENSLDAGAKNITVEFNNGGATFLRITDDGCGMAPEDAGIAFLRHATSKLKDARGLEAIGTMGFRGEALAAVGSVSRIELQTRERGAPRGTLLTLEAGDISEMGECGCPEGTTVTVRDIFFNTPARLKFLKSDRAEAAACIQAALRCALGRPEVSVRCIRDGREEFFTPGDGRPESAVYALLGREVAAGMLEVKKAEDERVFATGFVSSPAAGRGNRSAQFFFCNGRFIKSQLLQAAVEQAYKNSLLVGRYPACVIYLTISPGAVDVNVHPAKTEVKFTDQRYVFDSVHYAVRSALEGEDRVKKAQNTSCAPADNSPKKASYAPFTGDFSEPTPEKKPEEPPEMPEIQLELFTPATERAAPFSAVAAPRAAYITSPMPSFVPASATTPEAPENPAAPAFRLVGEAMDTYIIAERGEELILIDKHACHERIIFDRLKRQTREIMSQSLLVPVTLRLDFEQAEVLEKSAEELVRLGFEVSPFGEADYIIRAVPAELPAGEAAAALEEICEKLSKPGVDPAAAQDEILHTVACKAAIKAGWKTAPEELSRLVEAVLSGEVKYCPHGRPVSITLTKKDLDKQFKRIL